MMIQLLMASQVLHYEGQKTQEVQFQSQKQKANDQPASLFTDYTQASAFSIMKVSHLRHNV